MTPFCFTAASGATLYNLLFKRYLALNAKWIVALRPCGIGEHVTAITNTANIGRPCRSNYSAALRAVVYVRSAQVSNSPNGDEITLYESITAACRCRNARDVNKTFSSRPRPRPRLLFQDQDQDQDQAFLVKTKTKTLHLKTKTKTKTFTQCQII